MRQPRRTQLFRTLTIFVLTGWACAVAVRITDTQTSVLTAICGLTAFRAAILGLAAGLPWAPLAAWSTRSGWRRAALGGLAGTFAGVLGVTIYFWLWPPVWDAGHMATLKVFYKTYGLRVGPLSAVGGILAALWSDSVPSSPSPLHDEALGARRQGDT